MKKIFAYNRKLININKLVAGNMYLTMEGYICIYLGRIQIDGAFAFYVMGSMPLLRSGMGIGLDVPNFEDLAEIYKNYYNKIMSNNIWVEHSVVEYKTSPRCYYDFGGDSNAFENWYLLSNLQYDDVPQISFDFKKPVTVKVKELEVGGIYITSEYNVNTSKEYFSIAYMYLGRTRNKKFIWQYIGLGLYGYKDIENRIIDRLNHLGVRRFSITKNNKKVYQLSEKLVIDVNKLNKGFKDKLRKAIDDN